MFPTEVPHGQVLRHGSVPAFFFYNWVFVCASLVEHMWKTRGVKREPQPPAETDKATKPAANTAVENDKPQNPEETAAPEKPEETAAPQKPEETAAPQKSDQQATEETPAVVNKTEDEGQTKETAE